MFKAVAVALPACRNREIFAALGISSSHFVNRAKIGARERAKSTWRAGMRLAPSKVRIKRCGFSILSDEL